MDEFPLHTTASFGERPPWRNIMLLFGFILLGMSVGNLVSLLVVMLLSQFSTPLGMDDLPEMFKNPARFPHAWAYIMINQALVHLFTFLIPSLLYWNWSERHQIVRFIRRPWPSLPVLGLCFLVIVGFMPFNGWIIEWNSELALPAGLDRIEKWMQLKENELGILSHFLMNFDQIGQLAIALLVVAVIPALGEEVLFRGMIQRKIYNKTGDMHAAIWVSAILFSGIHFQFYGFVPRMLLGAMFGYLYAWSHNLWTPIFGHFINNGFTILMLFLQHRGLIDLDIESKQSSVSWLGAAASLLLTAVLLFNLKKIAQRASFSYDGA
jgi:uncharacterized protein